MIELRGVNGDLRQRVLAIQVNQTAAGRQLAAAIAAMVAENSDRLQLTAAAAGRLTTELRRAQRAARLAN